jgi:hypothetical protein
MYFTSCFSGVQVTNEDFLFPGSKQEQRFSKILNRVLIENRGDVRALGYDVSQIGTHSIRKGAGAWLILPESPSNVAVLGISVGHSI